MKSTTLTSKVEGSTTIIFIVPEGTNVNAGDLVVELDSAPLVEREKTQEIAVSSAESLLLTAEKAVEIQETQNLSDMAAAQLKLDLAELDLDKFKNGDFLQQQNELRSLSSLAEEKAQQAKEYSDFMARLVKKGYKTQNDLEQALITEKTERTNFNVAEEKLKVLEKYMYDRTIKELTALAEESKNEIARVKLKGEAALAQAQSEVKAKSKSFEVEQDKHALLKRQIAACKIIAPQDGQVIYANQRDGRSSEQVLIEEGSTVRERQQIVTLPDLSGMKVNARIHESRISLMRPGLPVTVKIDAFPDENYRGVVDTVASVPSSTGSSYMRDIKEYEAIVRLLDQDDKVSKLRPGLTAQLEVLVESRDEVLQAPIQSVLTIIGKQFAFFVNGNRVGHREVTVGQTNERMVEILKGADVGDEVVMNPRSHFERELKELEAKLVQEQTENPPAVVPPPNGLPGIAPQPPGGLTPGQAPPNFRPGSEPGPGPSGGGNLPPGSEGRRAFDPLARFQQQDANGDGKLTSDEWSERMKDRAPGMDKDGDGAVSLDEYKTAMANFVPGAGGGQPPRAVPPTVGGSE
jgi:HlyD family secretion protein